MTGIDYSSFGGEAHNPEMKKYLKQGVFYGVISELYSAKKTYDFINADNVLEHLPELERVFDCLKKVSRDGAIVCVTVPNDYSRIQKLVYEIGQIDTAFWVAQYTSEHFSYFSKDSLCSLGKASGYEKIIATSDWPIDFFSPHDRTNYKKNGAVGHDCHVACTLLENSV